jgi:hypothetical protein
LALVLLAQRILGYVQPHFEGPVARIPLLDLAGGEAFRRRGRRPAARRAPNAERQADTKTINPYLEMKHTPEGLQG